MNIWKNCQVMYVNVIIEDILATLQKVFSVSNKRFKQIFYQSNQAMQVNAIFFSRIDSILKLEIIFLYINLRYNELKVTIFNIFDLTIKFLI